MYLTIQDFENFIQSNEILPLSKETHELLSCLEKSLDVESIEKSILQFQQEKALLKSQSNTSGENKYKNNFNNQYYQRKTDGKTEEKWSKNASVPRSHPNSHSNYNSHSSKSAFHSNNSRNTGFSSSTSSNSSLKEPTIDSPGSASASSPKTEEKWVKYVETFGEFKPTKIETKEGIEKTINEIRIILNKMTKKNYEIQRNKILESISHILQEETNQEGNETNQEGNENETNKKENGIDVSLHKIAQFIFDISSSNKFFTEIYANLYKELIDIYPDVYREILNTFIFHFKDSIQTFCFCDPNTNYEKYCEFIKEGDRKKAITTFIIMLLNRGVISPTVVIEITHSFQTLIQQYIKEDERNNEIEELGEILYILVSLGNETIRPLNNDLWNDVIQQIGIFTAMKIKEHKSLSTRFIFKMKDLNDLL